MDGVAVRVGAKEHRFRLALHPNQPPTRPLVLWESVYATACAPTHDYPDSAIYQAHYGQIIRKDFLSLVSHGSSGSPFLSLSFIYSFARGRRFRIFREKHKHNAHSKFRINSTKKCMQKKKTNYSYFRISSYASKKRNEKGNEKTNKILIEAMQSKKYWLDNYFMKVWWTKSNKKKTNQRMKLVSKSRECHLLFICFFPTLAQFNYLSHDRVSTFQSRNLSRTTFWRGKKLGFRCKDVVHIEFLHKANSDANSSNQWIVTWSRWTHSVRGCVCVCWFVVTLLMCARTHLFRSLSLPPSEFCLKDKTNDRIEIREQGIYVTTYITYVHKQAGWHIHERAY